MGTQVSHRQQYENKMKEDYGSYRRTFCSSEKKALENSGLYWIRTLVLCAIPVERSSNFLTSQLRAGNLIGSL